MSITYGSADFVAAMKGAVVSAYPLGHRIDAQVVTPRSLETLSPLELKESASASVLAASSTGK